MKIISQIVITVNISITYKQSFIVILVLYDIFVQVTLFIAVLNSQDIYIDNHVLTAGWFTYVNYEVQTYAITTK